MNITGGTSLILYEVNEAADIVSSAADPEVNMIFGAVINEDLKNEILVTVIATGFADNQRHVAAATRRPQAELQQQATRSAAPQQPSVPSRSREMEEDKSINLSNLDNLDIPAFLRNRRRKK